MDIRVPLSTVTRIEVFTEPKSTKTSLFCSIKKHNAHTMHERKLYFNLDNLLIVFMIGK